MLIAVEATRLEREVRGIGRYMRALMPRLVDQDPELRLMLFASSDGGVERLESSLAADPALRGRFTVRPVREMARAPADVYWYPWNVVSPAPRHGPSVVTVHDVAPVALPDPRWLAWRKNLRWRIRYRRSARLATLMLADSAFTATEIQRVLGVGAARIRVAPLAADDFAPASSGDDTETLVRLGVRPPYVLAVGAADRRKNLGLLHHAMRTVVAEHRDASLVLAGPRRGAVRNSPDEPWSRTLGFVGESDLAALYRNAHALVMPSTYEGFGLPVLEAMQVGTPVICARAASLTEVAGDAALWVAPGDERELSAAISRVLESEALRKELSAKSLRRSRLFSWSDTASRTLRAFAEARELYELAARGVHRPLLAAAPSAR